MTGPEVGLKKKIGAELILAGPAWVPLSKVASLIREIVLSLDSQSLPALTISDERLGQFVLRKTDRSWNDLMLFGAYDYYQTVEVDAWQLYPLEEETRTIDVPDMDQPYSPEQPVWQWLDGGWPYSVPSDLTVVTNLDALLGYAVSELMRWEKWEWEMFSGSGPEVPEDEMQEVPLATLLAFDPSLLPALEVPVGSGLFREFDEESAGPWQPWTSRC